MKRNCEPQKVLDMIISGKPQNHKKLVILSGTKWNEGSPWWASCTSIPDKPQRGDIILEYGTNPIKPQRGDIIVEVMIVTYDFNLCKN